MSGITFMYTSTSSKYHNNFGLSKMVCPHLAASGLVKLTESLFINIIIVKIILILHASIKIHHIDRQIISKMSKINHININQVFGCHRADWEQRQGKHTPENEKEEKAKEKYDDVDDFKIRLDQILRFDVLKAFNFLI